MEITSEYLKKYGFTKDESAPEGVNRWHKKKKGCDSFYAWILFTEGMAVESFIRKTQYLPTGHVVETKVFSQKENLSMETFTKAKSELNMDILNE